VYFNTHKSLFSLKALTGDHKGLVVAHLNSLILKDVQFRVSEAGRQRVLKNKQKNVHAGIVGTLIDASFQNSLIESKKKANRITYNPYKYSTFVIAETEFPIYNAPFVTLNDGKVFVYD